MMAIIIKIKMILIIVKNEKCADTDCDEYDLAGVNDSDHLLLMLFMKMMKIMMLMRMMSMIMMMMMMVKMVMMMMMILMIMMVIK